MLFFKKKNSRFFQFFFEKNDKFCPKKNITVWNVLCQFLFIIFLSHKTKNPIKDGWLEPSKGRQKGKAKEKPKDAQPKRASLSLMW